MIDIGTALRHYKRKDVQDEIVLHSKDKEVVGSFGGQGYGKRPDVINYPRDVLELVKQGITSFHASEELWSNPLQLDPMLKKEELERLRIGWDLVIDIDCPYFEYSKIAADLIVKALKHHGIESISAKFSGNKGFHIGVPFEAFPKNIAGKEVSKRFPEATREVAIYLKNMVKDIFAAKIFEMEKGDINKIATNLKKKPSDIIKRKVLDGDVALDIDTILISTRHLYRAPYSLHEKSGLVSLPVYPEKVLEFNKSEAEPSKVVINPELGFLDRKKAKPNEAKDLFDKATAEAVNRKERIEFKIEERKAVDVPETAIPEKLFPPCVHNMLAGLEDGKKRSMFILTNFLTSVGWSNDDIEKALKEWNKNNKEPLREVLIVGHIRHHKKQKKNILPPNCQNQMYYKDFGVCKPDNLCAKIKNPVQYAKRKAYYIGNSKNNAKKEKKVL